MVPRPWLVCIEALPPVVGVAAVLQLEVDVERPACLVRQMSTEWC